MLRRRRRPDEGKVQRMDISDWESPDPGLLLTPQSEEDWTKALDRYLGTPNDGPLLRCVSVARANGAKSVVVETRYLGQDYRSEYAHFYSRTFARIPDSAHRLHFFAKELRPDDVLDLPADATYLGYVVVRPSRLGAVARAMLEPPALHRAAVRTAVTEVVHLFGQPLSVSGVPFTQQDSRLGACAHSSAWMCHATAALRGDVQMRPTGDFAVEADSSLLPARTIPTSGLTVAQLSDLLRRLGLPPMFYLIGALPDIALPSSPLPPMPVDGQEPGHWDTRIIPTVCRHLNGGHPVLIGTADHAFVLCGWWRESGIVRLLRHDDQQGPYLPVDDPLNDHLIHPDTGRTRTYGPWRTIHVPMPAKAWLLPESAESKGGAFLFSASEPYAKRVQTELGVEVDSLATLNAADRLSFRTYVIGSSAYKMNLTGRGWAADARVMMRLARMPRYVVVVEAIDRQLRDSRLPCVLGEAVFDATSADVLPELIAVRLHGIVATYVSGNLANGPKITEHAAVLSGAMGLP